MKLGGPESKKEHNLELKYCEWCGGLWLRRASGAGSLCGGCSQLVNAFPRLWGAKLKRREALKPDVKAGVDSCGTCTSVTCATGMLCAAKGEFAC
jgi:hypothetical protein